MKASQRAEELATELEARAHEICPARSWAESDEPDPCIYARAERAAILLDQAAEAVQRLADGLEEVGR